MSTIWIVEGSTGEYSDHCEWPVRAFRDEAKAQRLVVEAQARANEIFTEDKGLNHWLTIRNEKNEFDHNMQIDYTGTHYTCYPIELEE